MSVYLLESLRVPQICKPFTLGTSPPWATDWIKILHPHDNERLPRVALSMPLGTCLAISLQNESCSHRSGECSGTTYRSLGAVIRLTGSLLLFLGADKMGNMLASWHLIFSLVSTQRIVWFYLQRLSLNESKQFVSIKVSLTPKCSPSGIQNGTKSFQLLIKWLVTMQFWYAK